MLTKAESPAEDTGGQTSAQTAAATWLAAFQDALSGGNQARLRPLFHADSYWRDVLALTWGITTFAGADTVIGELSARAKMARPDGFAVASDRTSPRGVMRAGTDAIEAIFRFETQGCRGSGVLRLTPDAGDGGKLKAWTLLTVLDEIKGHEEKRRGAQPGDKAYSRDFRGPNWLDVRKATAAYADRNPTVLVIGGGQAGLSAAACLGQLGLDTLIVDRWPRIGDNWRKRYHALVLHNQMHVNHLPYMRFPPNWPAYIPKDKIAGWFEAYVDSMELNYWPSTTFEAGSYDETAGRWSVTLRNAGGATRKLQPRHIVMATGLSGAPSIPKIPGLENFAGPVLHSSQYDEGEAWRGKQVLVIGSGNSGHDIAQDLRANGAKVTLVQRSSTMVVNVEPSAQLPYALYDEGPPLEDCDLITMSMPLNLVQKSHQILTQKAKQIDQELLDGLERKGFRLDFGDGGAGWQFKFWTRGGGYYFNVGCSDLIVKGEVGLVQFADIAGFTAGGARTKTGEILPADLIVLATGYKDQNDVVRQLFGAGVADRIGPIWGFGEGSELRNMFVRTPQPGLWFIAGSFAQCRIYSKYLALQIKASEIGLLD